MPASLTFAKSPAALHCKELLACLKEPQAVERIKALRPKPDLITEFLQAFVYEVLRGKDMSGMIFLLKLPVIQQYIASLKTDDHLLSIINLKLDAKKRQHVCEIVEATRDEVSKALPICFQANAKIKRVVNAQQDSYAASRARLARWLVTNKSVPPHAIVKIFHFAMHHNDPITFSRITALAAKP